MGVFVTPTCFRDVKKHQYGIKEYPYLFHNEETIFHISYVQ